MVMLLALENAELKGALLESRRELADARARIIGASDRGRRELERDLHDGAQQRLTTIQIKLRMAEDAAPHEDLARQLESISTEMDQAIDELRALAHGIYPAVLKDQGLAAAVRSLARRAPIPVRVVDEGIGRYSAAVEAAAYFCTLEAVQNATKHAGADARVTVVIGRGSRRGIRFEVTDDGAGINMAVRSDGIGLLSMRDRIGAVGGELDVFSSPGAGTTVRGTIPDDFRPFTEPMSDPWGDPLVASSETASVRATRVECSG